MACSRVKLYIYVHTHARARAHTSIHVMQHYTPLHFALAVYLRINYCYQNKFYSTNNLNIFNLEHGTDRYSRNIGFKPLYAA